MLSAISTGGDSRSCVNAQADDNRRIQRDSPNAGQVYVSITRFALYFGAGSALGAFVPLALGVAFRAQIEEMIAWLGAFGGYALAGMAAAIMLHRVPVARASEGSLNGAPLMPLP